jgi:hypothetical protein
MRYEMSTVYGIWGGLVVLLGAQAAWSLFVGYPAAFERMLRRGRAWVYVPQRWKGLHKFYVLLASRLLVAAIALLVTLLLSQYTGRVHAAWLAGFFAVAWFAATWLQGFWSGFRYRQQEDGYFLMLDELRAKMEQENKDFNDAQLRSLSAYQHQQRLHVADEGRRFLEALASEARRFRQARQSRPAGPPPLPEA